jgi:hypothetical protein
MPLQKVRFDAFKSREFLRRCFALAQVIHRDQKFNLRNQVIGGERRARRTPAKNIVEIYAFENNLLWQGTMPVR